jgi:hypothetical protein
MPHKQPQIALLNTIETYASPGYFVTSSPDTSSSDIPSSLGSLRQAQKFLGKKINELGANIGRDGAKIRLHQYLVNLFAVE